MAILRKCKLYWAAANGDDIVGYRIYWAHGAAVGYDANSFVVGKITETAVPDEINLTDGPAMFGITAIDRQGNESDMTTLAAPFQMQVPEPPQSIAIEPADAFTVIDDPQAEIVDIEAIRDLVAQLEANRVPVQKEASALDDGQGEAEMSTQFDIGSLF